MYITFLSIKLKVKKLFNKKSLLIFSTIFSMYYTFLYMSIILFLLFLLFSFLLIFIEKNYITKIIKKYNQSIYVLLIYMIAFSMPFIMLNNFSTPIYFLLTLWSILLAIVFLKIENLFYVFSSIKWLLYTFIIFTLGYLYITYGKYPIGYSLEHMTGEQVSANGITSFANIILGVYTILSFKLKKENTLVASLFVLYISVEGYGRGSIIFSLMLILINILYIYQKNKIFFKIIFIASGSVLIVFISPFVYDIYLTTKLASGFETPRTIILEQYLNKIDVFSLLFGVSYSGTIIESMYNNNPHITYIRSHHIFGLFYLLSLFYIIGRKSISTFKSKIFEEHMIFLIIVAVLIRNITEPLFFPSIFDSLFLLILFLPKNVNL